MADFSNQDIQGAGYSAPPQQAVAPAPNMIQSVAQSNILGGLGSLFSGIAQSGQNAKAQEAADTKNKILSGYAQKVTALNSAVEQGQKSMAVAQREQRALYNKVVANFPGITEDLTAFNSKLLASEGLGDVLAKGTAVEQQIQADTKAATAAGFIQPNMSPQEQESGLNAYRQQQHQLNQMDFYSKQLEIQSKKMSIAASQENIAAARTQRANAALELQMKRNKQRLQGAVSDVASNYFTKTYGELDAIQKGIDAGQLTQEQALASIDRLANNFNAVTIQARGVAGGDYVDSLAKPIMDMLNARKDFFSGKIDKDVAQSKVDVAEAKAMLPIMADPKLAAMMSVSKLSGGVLDPAIMGQFSGYAVDFIRKNYNMQNPPANPTPHDDDEKEGAKVYMSSIKDVTNNLASKNPAIDDPKGTMEELRNHVNQVVAGVNDFAGAQKNPQQLNNVVDYFSSDEFLKYQRMGGTIDQANLEGAKNAISINYGDKLIPAIREEWERNKTTVGYPTGVRQVGRVTVPVQNQEATPEAVRYQWTGKTVVFKPAPGMESNRSVVAKAKELQQRLAPLINKSVRMAAHLDGSDDYSKYFQQNETLFFGEQPEKKDGE